MITELDGSEKEIPRRSMFLTIAVMDATRFLYTTCWRSDGEGGGGRRREEEGGGGRMVVVYSCTQLGYEYLEGIQLFT